MASITVFLLETYNWRDRRCACRARKDVNREKKKRSSLASPPIALLWPQLLPQNGPHVLRRLHGNRAGPGVVGDAARHNGDFDGLFRRCRLSHSAFAFGHGALVVGPFFIEAGR